MTTLNGLPRSWDSLIQGVCARKKLRTFSRLWEECTQEEARLRTREEKMGANDDQALTVHTRRNHNKREDHHHKRQRRPRRHLSSVRCYTCDERGHYSKDCHKNKGSSNKKTHKKRHHAHTIEDDEPARKRTREERVDSSSDEEYVIISARMETVTHGSNVWLVHSGESKHMTVYKESFVNLSEHESPYKVKLGDDYKYPIKESGGASYKLDSGKSLKMKDVRYVPRLKKNLHSISTLDAKGIRVAFIDGQVLMWPKGKTIDDVSVIGEKDGGLYKLKGQPEQALVHDSMEPNELWHRRLAHVHYIALPITCKAVSGLPKIYSKHERICKGCAQGNNIKKVFPNSESKAKGILEIVHLEVCGTMSSNSLSSSRNSKPWLKITLKEDQDPTFR